MYRSVLLLQTRWEDYGEIQQKLDLVKVVFLRHVESRWLSLLPAVERVKAQFPALLEYFKKLPETDRKIKKWEIQKDNDLFDISRDSCSDVFSWVFKACLWPISSDMSSRRTFNPFFASSFAASIEASDVQILEAEWTSGEDCKWTAEDGLKKDETPIERWWTRNWYKNQKNYKCPKVSRKAEAMLSWY